MNWQINCILLFIFFISACGPAKLDLRQAGQELSPAGFSGCSPEPAPEMCFQQHGSCAPLPESWNRALHSAFQRLPVIYQNQFCQVKALIISESMQSLGMTFAHTVYLNRQALENYPFIDDLLSSKEQLLFTATDDQSADHPVLRITSRFVSAAAAHGTTNSEAFDQDDFSTYSSLFFVLLHELSHVLASTVMLSPHPSQGPCLAQTIQQAWNEWRWNNEQESLFGEQKLCFYHCETASFDPDQVDQVYRQLQNSRFLSAYATLSPEEDFADSATFYVVQEFLSAEFFLTSKRGFIYPITARLNAREMKKELTFLRRVIGSRTLPYQDQAENLCSERSP